MFLPGCGRVPLDKTLVGSGGRGRGNQHVGQHCTLQWLHCMGRLQLISRSAVALVCAGTLTSASEGRAPRHFAGATRHRWITLVARHGIDIARLESTARSHRLLGSNQTQFMVGSFMLCLCASISVCVSFYLAGASSPYTPRSCKPIRWGLIIIQLSLSW
jgi:hypothetical protein